VVHAEIALGHQFLKVSKAEAEPEISANTQDDDFGFEVFVP
jgi:hypothetical protein